MKKILCVFLFLLAFGTCATSNAKVVKGTQGKGVKYTYNTSTKTLTVSGKNIKGKISKEYDGTAATENRKYEYKWDKYKEHAKKIVIKNGVEHIGQLAFYEFIYVSKLVLPKSLKSIGKMAFLGIGVKRIKLPDNVESIGDYAFYSGSFSEEYIEVVKLSKNLRRIGKHAFSDQQIEKIYIPKNVKAIGKEAFWECPLKKIVIKSNKLKKIEKNAFNQSENKPTIYIPKKKSKKYRKLLKNTHNYTKVKIVEY